MVLYAPMFGKILLTIAVVVGAFLVIRWRMRRRTPPPGGATSPLSSPAGRRTARWVAYALLGLMLGGSALYLVFDWVAQREIVRVRVVNAYTGESVRYEARRGDVQTRQFKTLEGRWVVLAEVERLELEGAD